MSLKHKKTEAAIPKAKLRRLYYCLPWDIWDGRLVTCYASRMAGEQCVW